MHPSVSLRHADLAGFSLVELIVVIVVSGILASTIGLFIAGPMQGFFDQARRGGLVDGAQLALVRMGRDLRSALPNTVRVSGSALELLYVLDGDRYRSESPGTAADRLDFTAADTSFNTLAPLDASQAAAGATLRLAIYPLGAGSGSDPYNNAVMTPSTVAVNIAAGTSTAGGAAETRVSLTPGFKFLFDSPSRRVYLVEGPVTWLCTGGELRRHSGYAVNGTQVVPPTGGTVVVIAKNVESCSFSYSNGTATRTGVANIAVTLESAGERIRLRRQVHVDNSP